MNDYLVVLTVMFVPGGLFFFVLSYLLGAENEQDAWFFLRRRQFNQKLLQHGHETIWSFLDELMLITASDWQKKSDRIIHKPYTNTTVRFRFAQYREDDSLMEIEIIEGTGIKEVFNLCLYDDFRIMEYGKDSSRQHRLTGKDRVRVKKVLFYLHEIWHVVRNEAIKTKNDSLQNEKTMVFNTKKPMRDASFAKDAEKNDTPILDPYVNHHLSTIYALLAELKQQERWLSVEALHQIHETFPNDLADLCETFQTVRDKQVVRADVESALQTMYQKLENFQSEAEENKHRMIKKRKLVIEKR